MWNERLKLASYCPLCGAQSARMELRPLGTAGDTQLLHATCGKCAAQVLTLTVVSSTSSGAVGLVTDLSADDVLRASGLPVIHTDDVLRVHALLDTPAEAWISRALPPSAVAAPSRRRSSARKPIKASRRGRPASS